MDYSSRIKETQVLRQVATSRLPSQKILWYGTLLFPLILPFLFIEEASDDKKKEDKGEQDSKDGKKEVEIEEEEEKDDGKPEDEIPEDEELYGINIMIAGSKKELGMTQDEIQELIEEHGGQVVTEVSECNVRDTIYSMRVNTIYL